MDLKLKNRIVLITGSSKGIGKIIAKKYLEEGCKVISTGRSKIKKKNIPNFFYYQVDFEKLKSVEKLKKKLKKKFKKIDILVGNIGNGVGSKDILINTNDWTKSFSNNFKSFFNAFNILYSMINQKEGSIIAISSITGFEALKAPIEYSVSKAAINAYCKCISKKLRPGMRVNVISPGNILMEGNTWYKKLKNHKRKTINYINNNVPMKKFGKPEDIANAALFLSSKLSSFTSGSNLIIDGGQTSKLI